jgi:hypothetical protein
VAALAAVSTLATPAGGAFGAVRASAAGGKAAPKKKVVTVSRTVNGARVECRRWGPLVVTLAVKKTTTTIGTRRTVKLVITDVRFPVYPDHTNRSIYINEQALPLLKEETLQLQPTRVSQLEMVSGATDTSVAFAQSLQAALLAAKKP